MREELNQAHVLKFAKRLSDRSLTGTHLFSDFHLDEPLAGFVGATQDSAKEFLFDLILEGDALQSHKRIRANRQLRRCFP